MGRPLAERLARAASGTADELLEQFLGYAADRGLSLYPAQEEAVLELFSGKHVILATPTGSGKSLVATALLFRTLANGGRAFWALPIRWVTLTMWSRSDASGSPSKSEQVPVKDELAAPVNLVASMQIEAETAPVRAP